MRNPLAQILTGLRKSDTEAPRRLSQPERQRVVADIVVRQERLCALAAQARALRQPPHADEADHGSIPLTAEASLRLDPDRRTWQFLADPGAEPIAVQFAGVRYGVAHTPAVVVDADNASFSVQLPRSPGKLTARTAPSELLRRALSRPI